MIKDDEKIILNVGDYTKENNQEYLIRAVGNLKDKTRKIKIIFVGKDKLDGKLKQIARECDIVNNVIFLDISEKETNMLYAISDMYVDVSKVKSYPKELVIAMINYLPIISLEVRGNNELIENNVTGYIVNEDNIYDLSDKIMLLYSKDNIASTFVNNCTGIYNNYLTENVINQMCNIYNEILK